MSENQIPGEDSFIGEVSLFGFAPHSGPKCHFRWFGCFAQAFRLFQTTNFNSVHHTSSLYHLVSSSD
jgi:hypothetical protein